MWSGTSVADQRGYPDHVPDTAGMNPVSANPTGGFNPQSRNASSLLIENTLTWLTGSHSLEHGWFVDAVRPVAEESAAGAELHSTAGHCQLAILPGDVHASEFPWRVGRPAGTGAEPLRDHDRARHADRRQRGAGRRQLASTQYLGNSIQRSRMREAGFFIQDSWRVRPDLTINAGLRYELQFPFTPRNDSYSTATVDSFCGVSGTNPDTICNLFQPGATPGARPTFVNFGSGTPRITPTTTTSRLASAWPGRCRDRTGLIGHDPRQERRRLGHPRRLHARVQPRRHGAVLRSIRRKPGRDHRRPTRNEANGNLGALPFLFRDESGWHPRRSR